MPHLKKAAVAKAKKAKSQAFAREDARRRAKKKASLVGKKPPGKDPHGRPYVTGPWFRPPKPPPPGVRPRPRRGTITPSNPIRRKRPTYTGGGRGRNASPRTPRKRR